jgi:hypothetical protein
MVDNIGTDGSWVHFGAFRARADRAGRCRGNGQLKALFNF